LRADPGCLPNRFARKVNGENAARGGYVADMKKAIIRLDATLADGKPQAEPGLVRADLCKGQNHSVHTAWGQATAVIVDFEEDAIGDRIGGQRHHTAKLGEFKRVLEQVAERRKQHVAVDIDRKALFDMGYRKPAASGTRLEQSRDADLINEIGNGNEFVPGQHSGGDSDVRERPVNQRAQPDQGALQDRPSCPMHPDIAQFDSAESERGRVQQVPQLVCEKSQAFIQRLDAVVRQDRIALVGVLGDSVGDAIVKAAVECPEFIRFYRRVEFERQIRDGLTQIAVVVNDLIDGESLLQELTPMERRSGAHLRPHGTVATGRTGDHAAQHGV